MCARPLPIIARRLSALILIKAAKLKPDAKVVIEAFHRKHPRTRTRR